MLPWRWTRNTTSGMRIISGSTQKKTNYIYIYIHVECDRVLHALQSIQIGSAKQSICHTKKIVLPRTSRGLTRCCLNCRNNDKMPLTLVASWHEYDERAAVVKRRSTRSWPEPSEIRKRHGCGDSHHGRINMVMLSTTELCEECFVDISRQRRQTPRVSFQ